jgi:hypothetical protein
MLMLFRRPALIAAPIAALAMMLAACGSDAEPQAEPQAAIAQDPLLARALNDPLMVDPDLAWRNEANAVIAFRDGHPLPPFEAREDAANRARDAARVELLDDGQIPAMPMTSSGETGVMLAGLMTAGAMLEALGGPENCASQLEEGLGWAARMPATATIMPHGMVEQAAGVEKSGCSVRVVRYLTPVGVEDALEYHFTKADRARLRVSRFDLSETSLRGTRRDQEFVVHARSGRGGMTAVDIVHWKK